MAARGADQRGDYALGIAVALVAVFSAFAGWAEGNRMAFFSWMHAASWIASGILLLAAFVRMMIHEQGRRFSVFGIFLLVTLVLGHVVAGPLYSWGRRGFLAEVSFQELAVECRALALSIEEGSHPKFDFTATDAARFPTIHRFHFSAMSYDGRSRRLLFPFEPGIIFDVMDQGQRIICRYDEDNKCWVLQMGNRDGWRRLAEVPEHSTGTTAPVASSLVR